MKGDVHCGVSNPKEDVMAKMLIKPQDWPKRLHEWVAVERGYFDEVGLEYRFSGSPPEWDELIPGGFVRKAHEEMVETAPTGFCDCSWGVVVSTGAGAGRFIPDFHTEAYLCIYARPDAGIMAPSDLAGKPIAVSELTGSHFSTIEALERHIDRKDIPGEPGLSGSRSDFNLSVISLFRRAASSFGTIPRASRPARFR